MCVSNYLVEGVSGAGKTLVRTELQRRGHHAVNDATAPHEHVVDELLRRSRADQAL
jgi:predicted ATPase